MAEEMTEVDQRKTLEQNGWVPTGQPLGEGGGARVFKVVPMGMIHRIAETFLLPADMDTARKRALPAAELIAGAVSGDETLVAAGKVTKHPDERLKREIEILADVQHPHLIRMLAHDKSSAPTWYVMPVMKGMLKERKDFKGNVLGVLRGMLDVARALSALHHHPKRIVHRDIKPGNIFVTDDGRWILGDPGVAYRDDGKDMTTTRVWSKDWAPTWPDDKLCQSPKSDLYMLGATGLAVLVGEKPLNPSYLDEPEHDLPKLFPAVPAIDQVFALFRKLYVGPRSKDLPFEDAAALISVLEQHIALVENDRVRQIEVALEAARMTPRLVLSFATSHTNIASGDQPGLKGVPIWIPENCNQLVVWQLGHNGHRCGIRVTDIGHDQLLFEQHTLVDNAANHLEVPAEARGQFANMTITNQSGMLYRFMIYADASTLGTHRNAAAQ